MHERHGIGGVMRQLEAHGLPTAMGYLVFLGEVVGPVLLLLGIFTRLAALSITATMLFAIYLVHSDEVFQLSAKSGAWAIELQALFLFGSLAVALLGPDRFALGRRVGGLRG